MADSYETELAELQKKYQVDREAPLKRAKQRKETLEKSKAELEKHLEDTLARLNKEWADVQAETRPKIEEVTRDLLRVDGLLEYLEPKAEK